MKTVIFTFIFVFTSSSAFASDPCKTTAKSSGCKASVSFSNTFPSEKIKQLINLIKTVNKNLSPSAKKSLFARLDKFFDFDFMAKAALQSEWSKLTDAQKQEYSRLFALMLKNNYAKKLYKHKKYKIKITSEKVKRSRARVGVQLKKKSSSNEVPVEIIYKMKKNSNGWGIYDVVTDEVSLVKNYRSAFKRMIKQKGFSHLINYLKKHSR